MKSVLLHADCLEALKEIPDNSIDSMVTDPPAGISFMDKEWDKSDGFIPFMTDVMKEALRTLKPGAHALVWAIPRTSHWTATALENAGFEIRDVITHLFGTGFPKSLDISKAIDKAAGAEREVIGRRTVTRSLERNGRKGDMAISGGNVIPADLDITAPSTPEAKQWQGWGTALKPASEHWILVRKPISEKTVAANTLKHGTGGINIDASRIDSKPRTTHSLGNIQGTAPQPMSWGEKTKHVIAGASGRFPSNLILDEEAAKLLDKQSGFEASRFFYCAKASKTDKGEENIHPTVKSTTLMTYLIKLITPPGGIVLDPFMGSGSTGVAAIREGFEFIGIEKEAEYFAIAEKRIEHEEASVLVVEAA